MSKTRERLLRWYAAHGRHSLPWRKTTDPYKILVSELMLQQTQVSRVIPKYEAFLQSFPTLDALANAERAAVLLHWQGLGYNNRAVRLHLLAKQTASTGLPTSREELLSLPGIGPYTAGAILIFAHHTPAESIDVNVERVIKRLFWAQSQQPSKKEVSHKALQFITPEPHAIQSALMDFGSAVCKPQPLCKQCPLSTYCKSKGRRPEEVKKKSAPFVGSNRWWRGKILAALLEGPKTREQLHRIADDPEKVEAALQSMEADGLIQRGTTISLKPE